MNNEGVIGERTAQPREKGRLKKAFVKAVMPLAMTAGIIGAGAVGAEIGSVIQHAKNSSAPTIPGKIAEGIREGTVDLIDTAKAGLGIQDNRPEKFKSFGGGRSGGGGAVRGFGGKGGTFGGGGTSR